VTPKEASQWKIETLHERDGFQNEELQMSQRLSNYRSEALTLATRISEMDDAKKAVKKRLSDQKKLLEELKQANYNLNNRLQEINALYEAGKSLGYTTDISKLLDKIVALAAEVTQAEIGSLMLINEETDILTIKAYRGLDREIADTVSLPLGSSIAGYVAQSGEPLMVDDVEKDERFKRINKERYSSASLLCVPLKITNRVLGVINMANKRNGASFTEHDLKLLTTFAAQAAVAIDDARQFENNRQKLHEFSRDIILASLKMNLLFFYSFKFNKNSESKKLSSTASFYCYHISNSI